LRRHRSTWRRWFDLPLPVALIPHIHFIYRNKSIMPYSALIMAIGGGASRTRQTNSSWLTVTPGAREYLKNAGSCRCLPDEFRDF